MIASGADVELAEGYVAAPGAEADRGVQSRELRDSLELALAAVDEPYRSIVVMREIQDMTYSEIVDAVEMPLNTVKVYLHRGRNMLREALRGKV